MERVAIGGGRAVRRRVKNPSIPSKSNFEIALIRYREARRNLDLIPRSASEPRRDSMTAALDRALEALLAEPSSSLAEFGAKLRILEAEFGLDAQPDHLAAIYADARLMPWGPH